MTTSLLRSACSTVWVSNIRITFYKIFLYNLWDFMDATKQVIWYTNFTAFQACDEAQHLVVQAAIRWYEAKYANHEVKILKLLSTLELPCLTSLETNVLVVNYMHMVMVHISSFRCFDWLRAVTIFWHYWAANRAVQWRLYSIAWIPCHVSLHTPTWALRDNKVS